MILEFIFFILDISQLFCKYPYSLGANIHITEQKRVSSMSKQNIQEFYELRWHGRGGQGAVTGAMILAKAAFLYGYKGVTAAPFFGAERRGAPIIATNRIASRLINTYSLVENPDIVIVLDETLLNVVDVTKGLKEYGIIIINTPKTPGEIPIPHYTIATTNASENAKKAGLIVEGIPIVNTSILGGISRATGMVNLESIEKVIQNHFPPEIAKKNIEGTELTFESTLLNQAWPGSKKKNTSD